MNINFHGAEYISSFSGEDFITAKVGDRQGNELNLFFESVHHLEAVAAELTELAMKIHQEAES